MSVTKYKNVYTPNETIYILRDDYYTAPQRICFCGPGYLGSADAFFPNYQDVPYILAANGFTVIIADTNGTSTWGNDATVTAIDNAVTWCRGLFPDTKSDGIVMQGGSMFTLNALNYTKANPTKVKAMVIELPALNLKDLHDNRFLDYPTNTIPLLTPIEAAYGGTAGYNAALAAHDPAQNTATFKAWGGRINLLGSETDPIAIPDLARAFVASVGSTASYTNFGNFGHYAGPGSLLPGRVVERLIPYK